MSRDTLVNPHAANLFTAFFVIFSLISISNLQSQSKIFYTKLAIIQDLNYLVSDIEQIHPAPYHSIEKTDFIRRIEDMKNELPDSISIIDAWKMCYEIMALLKEGHSYFLPPFSEIGDFGKFPYTIKIDETSNTFIVRGSLLESIKAPIGKRIISINGVSTDSLISIFNRSTSAENNAFCMNMNETHFDISLYAIFGTPEFFDIEFLLEGKVEKERCQSIKYAPEKITPNYTFNVMHDSIGLIDMNGLNSYSEFKKFCKHTFKSLKKKKIVNLIIDFRGNVGGDSQIGDELIKYLSDVPFIQYQKAVVKVSSVSRDRFGYPFEKDTLLVQELEGSSEHMIQPYTKKKRFAGNVYVLIDGGTFSSAGSTVWCIKHYDMATIIGTETGGTGVHYGYPIFRKLPNTGLSYFVSHIKWYQVGADDFSCHGLYPDYKIDLSIDDILNKRDAALNFALELIRRRK